MRRRRIGEAGWSDVIVMQHLDRRRDRLREISGHLDWGRFEGLLSGLYPSNQGEPAYPPVMMLKVLLLQRWYQLSDPEMEHALADRLSFRRFCGLALEDETPDHTTIWRFRERLGQAGVLEAVFAELGRQLEGQGLVMKRGTLIDASIVRSAARRPRMSEGPGSKVDPDARFGTGNERGLYEFGYKLHVAVDQGSALIRGVVVTPANVQEVMEGPSLIQGDEQVVYADRGYDAARMRDRLSAGGIANGIMKRGTRIRPVTAEEQQRNMALSLIRRPVEKVFGTLKRSYRMDRMRYFNISRNRTALVLACMAYNLRRMQVMMATP